MASLPLSFRFYDPIFAIIKEQLSEDKLVDIKTKNALAFNILTQTGVISLQAKLGLVDDA